MGSNLLEENDSLGGGGSTFQEESQTCKVQRMVKVRGLFFHGNKNMAADRMGKPPGLEARNQNLRQSTNVFYFRTARRLLT